MSLSIMDDFDVTSLGEAIQALAAKGFVFFHRGAAANLSGGAFAALEEDTLDRPVVVFPMSPVAFALIRGKRAIASVTTEQYHFEGECLLPGAPQ